MRSKQLTQAPSESFVLIFETGEEAMAGLLAFAEEHKLTAAHFTGIGAFSKVLLGYFDWEAKDYFLNWIDEQVEVVSLIGDIALENGKPKIHAHAVVGKRSGAADGGHLMEGHVRPTLEIVLTVSPAHLQREFDPASGLALIRL